MEHAVGVNAEGHLDLTAEVLPRSQAGHQEFAQEFILDRDLALPLPNDDPHCVLVFSCCGELLCGRDGDVGVADDDRAEQPTSQIEAEVERGDVEENGGVLGVINQRARMDRCTDGDHLLGVYTAAGLLLKHA